MVEFARQGAKARANALVTELVPLGSFATWQVERAVGNPDRNTLRLRVDPTADASAFGPGMTFWIHR